MLQSMFHAFQMFVAYVSSGCCKNRSGVAYVAMTIRICYGVCFKCFSYFKMYVASVLSRFCICCTGYTLCYKCMFQMFQMFQKYIASALSRCYICYSAHTYMLQTYVVNVLSVSDVCCSKCFMLQVFHEQAR
jgi:hypothetical protein